MGVKNAGITGSGRFGQAFLEGLKLATCCKQRCLKTSNFCIQFIILKVPEWDRFLLLEMDEHFPLRDPRGDGHALKNPFRPGGGNGLRNRIFFA